MNRNLLPRILLLSIALLFAACENAPSKSSNEPSAAPKPTPNEDIRLEDARIKEVDPTVDGGAYIRGYDESGKTHLWYARGGAAIKVYEVDEISLSGQSSPLGANKAFGLWIRERRKRKALKREKDELDDKVGELELQLSKKQGGGDEDHDN